MRFTIFLIITLSTCVIGCNKTKHTKFTLLPSDETGVFFRNDITETKEFNPVNYIYIYNGAGVGTGDINNDGLPDLFFAGNQVPSKLYINKGNMVFEDITETSGISNITWSTGVSFIDINTDGLMDIYVCTANKEPSLSQNFLYINQGGNRFKEEAKSYNLNDDGYSTQAVFFDYDEDGDLDMYLLTNGIESFNHNNMRPIKMDGKGKSTDRLYKNNGDNTFTNVSQEAGITIEGYGLGVGIMDVNDDGRPDIYCSNDFITNDLLWVNNGDGTFSNEIEKYFTQTSYNGMGMDIADFNNDGMSDLVQVDMLPESNLHNKTMTPAMNFNNQTLRFGLGYIPQYVRNTLQVRNKNASFSEVGRLAGIHKTDWSWAPLIADLDNDGLKDLFISNGYGKDITDMDYTVYSNVGNYPFGTDKVRNDRAYANMSNLPEINLPNYFYKNNGDLTFMDVTKSWSSKKPSMSNGATYVDLDLDGDLDLVSNNINQEAFIYKNNTRELDQKNTNFLSIELKGPSKNPNGIGAKVKLYSNNTVQEITQYPIRGYLSSIDYKMHFGLGNKKTIDSLLILWPGRKSQIIRNFAANKNLKLKYDEATQKVIKKQPLKNTFLTDISQRLSNLRHKENPYVDFLDQPLLLKMISREGPGLAVGDLNNDGLDDISMTTAIQDTTFIWTQQKDGNFKRGSVLPGSWKYEQQGCIIADFNNDSKPDIYVTSGGNEQEYIPENFQDQLYFQTQDGNYEVSTSLPEMFSSTSTVNAADFDGDGDLDLFVGSRIRPKSYPLADRSYILQNNNGIFEDITADMAPDLMNPGMVTSALWTDFDNDNAIDLIVVGEWMEISFYKNEDGKLKNVTSSTGIDGLMGFWNSINGADFDQDGDIDYIVANLGNNSELKASNDEPITIVAKDFDENGSMDPIIGHYVNGTNYPLASRDALISQIAGMKGRFPYYKDYGNAKFDDVFKPHELKEAVEKKINTLSTLYLENHGNGKLSYRILPIAAQLAPVYGISIADINSDGYLDALLTGNRKDTETLSGYIDSSLGTVLLGDGNGYFKTSYLNESGFHTAKDSRGITQLQTLSGTSFIVANNNDKMQGFVLKSEDKTIPLKQNDISATIELANGKIYKQEFYFGAGYLSQDSRVLKVPSNAKVVKIYNSKMNYRVIQP